MRIAVKLCDSYRRGKKGYHASCRLRWRALQKYWEFDIVDNEFFKMEYHKYFDPDNQFELLKGYDVVIFHKTYEYELAKKLKENGNIVIVDMSDPDYLLEYSGLNRSALCMMTMTQADGIVGNTQKLVSDLKEQKFTKLIPDRLDLSEYEPKKNQREDIKDIVYYGHADNHSRLDKYNFNKYNLTIVSNKQYEKSKYYRFVQWIPNTKLINQVIKESDAIFIGEDDKFSEYRSDNRTQTAIALGMRYTYNLKDWRFNDKKLENIDKSVEEYQNFIKELV